VALYELQPGATLLFTDTPADAARLIYMRQLNGAATINVCIAPNATNPCAAGYQPGVSTTRKIALQDMSFTPPYGTKIIFTNPNPEVVSVRAGLQDV